MPTTNVAKGDLLFLWHPETHDTFSGFGLAMEPGRGDLLAGLLMVDRPHPVSPAWLRRVRATFGDFELYVMTASHERGIACQLRVEHASLPYVRSLDVPAAQPMRRALMPLLVQPPRPRFCVKWNPVRQLWTSRFDIPRRSDHTPAAREPRFSLGQVVATPGALDALQRAHQTPLEFLARHSAGDWGDLVAEDLQENARALHGGGRLFSAYNLQDGTRIWVITEWDRSVTTVLLPSEY